MRIARLPRTSLALLAALALVGSAPSALAQKIKPGRDYFTCEPHGFRFKPPTEYDAIPLQPGQDEAGLVGKMSGPSVNIRVGNESHTAKSEIMMVAAAEPEQDEAADGRTSAAKKRKDLSELLSHTIRGFDGKTAENPEVDEQEKVGKFEARHRVWKPDIGGWVMVVEAWTFPLEQEDVSIVYLVPMDKADDFQKVFERSAKTFEEIERKERTALAAGASYDDKLAKADEEARRIAGWHAVPTPSQKYIIKTDSDNKKFIDEVIMRLEKSRELYERDFPPKKGFDHVSIVRVCATEEEFHEYGGTSGGVAGWFNPGTTELVLYDALNIDRNMTYAVMSHEAFHQYCHFLFDQSEAHRWFDEGHGDYYGGVEFKGNRAKITIHMPGGLDRVGEIKELVRTNKYKPIKQHINFDHGQWQTQGPSNVSCYAQSWSIIYMLREGALGNVRNRKVWKDEYANIIPNYIETLYNGFQEAYAEARKPILERAKAEGREPTADELDAVSHVSEKKKKEIWEKAIAASWGTIDLDEFEERWKLFVDKEL